MLSAAVALLAGCVRITPADPMRGDPAAIASADGSKSVALNGSVAPRWPARDAQWIHERAAVVRGVTRVNHRGVVRDGMNLIPFNINESRNVESHSITDAGAVFELTASPRPGAPATRREAADFLFVSKDLPPPPPSPLAKRSHRHSASPATESLRSASDVAMPIQPATPGPQATPPRISGLYVRMYDTIPDWTGNPPETVGIVVHLEGLAGVQYEQPVIDDLRSRGFVALATPFPWSRWTPMTCDLRNEEDVWEAAEELGRITDDCLGEAAYAIDGVISHLWAKRPDLRDKPVVLVGFSAGSLTLPAIAARLGDRVKAAVVVGSGANIIHISQTSTLTDGGVKVLAFDKPESPDSNQALRGILSGAYIKRCTLDPYHTAGLLVRTPVLQIHGSDDDIVPSFLGDELYLRLGKPERWTIAGGHRRVFLQMAGCAPQIGEWVMKHLPKPPSESPQSPAAAPAGENKIGNGSLLRP